MNQKLARKLRKVAEKHGLNYQLLKKAVKADKEFKGRILKELKSIS